jgi:hypothetical protein
VIVWRHASCPYIPKLSGLFYRNGVLDIVASLVSERRRVNRTGALILTRDGTTVTDSNTGFTEISQTMFLVAARTSVSVFSPVDTQEIRTATPQSGQGIEIRME